MAKDKDLGEELENLAGKALAEKAAELTAMMVGLVNLAWCSRVSTMAVKGRPPFASPGELETFRENTQILCAAMMMRDGALVTGTLKSMGLDGAAEGFGQLMERVPGLAEKMSGRDDVDLMPDLRIEDFLGE